MERVAAGRNFDFERLFAELARCEARGGIESNTARHPTETRVRAMTVRLGSIQVVAAGLLFAALKLT